MVQGYGKPVQNTRPTPYRLRQDLGYIPMRAPADGDGGGGISYTGGPSGGTFTLTPIPTGKFLGNLTGSDATPGATDYTFIGLTDVPAAYAGFGGSFVTVKMTEDGLEFTSTPSGPTSTWIPLVDGAEPPGFITDGAGHLILVAYPL